MVDLFILHLKKSLNSNEVTTTTVPETNNNVDDKPTAFCVKCKAKHVMENPEETNLKNGKPALKGICSNCKKTVFKITSSKKIKNN